MAATEESIAETQDRLAGEFELFDDWMDRYQLLIDQGRKLASLPEAERSEDLKVLGCQSQVWLKSDFDGERLHFRAASDAIITSGLISLLLEIYSGRRPQEILAAPFTLGERIGLQAHLSPSRANGFANMVKRIRDEAAARA
jgi:cysteine desulfuration protein SufE